MFFMLNSTEQLHFNSSGCGEVDITCLVNQGLPVPSLASPVFWVKT